jgi:2-oxoglutarate ferredoxin oxidoreductase subunit beta
MKTMLDDILAKPHIGTVQYEPKDFKPDVDVRWCAGCGGYSILSPVQRIMPELGIPKEKIAFISGIGCSGRFPYYMDVYGFHGIHGRAIAIASGLKIARPDLSVWVATGDGDNMSIGGNHFIHGCRRNVNLNVIMFNNEVYSLTKGQYSPLSHKGQITKSSPLGSLDEPFNPAALALGSGATFVARGIDRDRQHLQYLFERAAAHNGFSFIEVYTNCNIFNDGAFDSFTKKDVKDDMTVMLEHGKPMIFGKEKDKGIKLDGFQTDRRLIDRWQIQLSMTCSCTTRRTARLAFILGDMTYNPEVPRPLGVFQSLERPSYDDSVHAQIAHEVETKGEGDIMELMKGKESWEVK